MTSEERLDRIESNLDRLAGVVDTLASTVVAHDNQIEDLIKVGLQQARTNEQEAREIQELRKAIADLDKRWQAYINTLPRQ